MLITKKETYNFEIEDIIHEIKSKGGVVSNDDFTRKYSKTLNYETYKNISSFLVDLKKYIKNNTDGEIEDPIEYIIYLRYILRFRDKALFDKIGHLSWYEDQGPFCNGLLGSIFLWEYKTEKKDDTIERETHTFNEKIFKLLDNPEEIEKEGKIFNIKLYNCITNKRDKLIYLLSYLFSISYEKTIKKIYDLKSDNIRPNTICLGFEGLINSMGYGDYIDFNENTIKEIIEKHKSGGPIDIKIDKSYKNVSYLDFIDINDNGTCLTKSASPLKNYVDLIEKAKVNRKPILFIVRNKYIKLALDKIINNLTNFDVYTHTIDNIINEGINTESIENGIISFFDIPNLGKRKINERKLIKHIQNELSGTHLIFSNFSDKFKSNDGLNDTVRNGIVIDDNGTNTKELNESSEHGTCIITEVEKSANKDMYESLFNEFIGRNDGSYIGLIDSHKKAKEIKRRFGKKCKISIINSSNIGKFHSGEEKIEDYDLVLLDDNFIGYIDISDAEGAIYFDYLSLDKTRKTAKQLILDKPGFKKQLIYGKQLIPRYDHDNPKSNILGESSNIGKLLPKSEKEKIRKKNNGEKAPVEMMTYSLENRLGLEVKTDVKRLDNELLVEKLKEKLANIDTKDLFSVPIKELKKTFNQIPEFKETIKRTNSSSDLMNRIHYIILFKNLGLLDSEYTFNIEKDLFSYMGNYVKSGKENIKIIIEDVFGKEYKSRLVELAIKELESFGIKDYYDLMFYFHKIENKPETFKLSNFNSGNDKDINSLGEQIRKLGILNLVVLLFIDGVFPSIIKTNELEELGILLYGEKPNDDEFKEKVENEFKENFSCIENIETHKVRIITGKMPYFNLYCKLNGVKMAGITHEKLDFILSLLGINNNKE